MDARPATQAEEELLQHNRGRSIMTWASALFVVALVVFHGSFLFSYFTIRHGASTWPPAGHEMPPLAGMVVSTGLLFASVVPLLFGYLAIRQDRGMRLVLGLVGMLVLGWSFVALQAVSYSQLNLQPIDNVYSALIVTIAGFQLLMTLLGLMIGGLVLVRTLLGHFHSDRYGAVEALVFTWGFVAISWLLTAGTIYLTPYVF